MMDLGAALKAFAAVFPAELPDKTMIATVVLVARYRRPLLVWLGAAAAFTVHVVIAVAAGQLLSLLPDAVVSVATATLFFVGAVVLWRESRQTDKPDDEDHQVADADDGDATAGRSDMSVVAASFGVIVLAEWGDLTQLATAGIAASTGSPVTVAIGALLALWSVAGIAAAAGRTIAARLPVHRLQRAAALIFGGLALLTLSELL
jgi:putative Ca2+/H+ antiporter (TMEM165/GDT1 family)